MVDVGGKDMFSSGIAADKVNKRPLPHSCKLP